MASSAHEASSVPLTTIAREWTRLGVVGFGGPPTHIALLRRLCVDERSWIDASEFEDAIAAVNLLPGPASTQLAIFCAWRLRRVRGALIGGLCFIAPGLVMIVALAALFLARHPAHWVLGAAAGAGAGVPAVALYASWRLVGPSWRRIGPRPGSRVRGALYGALGALCAALFGPYLVVVIVACGAAELLWRHGGATRLGALVPAAPAVGLAGLGALAWVALKVGALSFGGGFVIVPLMQHDAVTTYHWMTGAQFLNAVALGQITPGPVVLTVAVVGYAARGLAGALLATAIAFAPSFLFVTLGAPRFHRLRANARATSFLAGAGPCVVGAIAGSAIPLGLALHHLWQVPVLAGALLWLFAARRGVVAALVLAGAVGVLLGASGVGI